MENIIFAAIIGFVIGTLFYYFDKKSGKNLYKKWHDISNKEKLNPELNLGFVNGRLFGQKLSVSIAIAVICYVLGFIVFGMSPFHGLFYATGMFVGILLSFYTAGKLLDVFSKRANKTIDYIESIEKGEKNIKDEFKKVIPKKEEQKTPKTEEQPKEEPKQEKKKDDDWRSGVKGFLDK